MPVKCDTCVLRVDLVAVPDTEEVLLHGAPLVQRRVLGTRRGAGPGCGHFLRATCGKRGNSCSYCKNSNGSILEQN